MKTDRYIAEYDNRTTGRTTFERFEIVVPVIIVDGRYTDEDTIHAAIQRAEALAGLNRKLVGVYAAVDLRDGD